MIRIKMRDSDAAIRTKEKLTEKIQIKKGVRQGNALSASLFTLSLAEAIKNRGIICRIIFFKHHNQFHVLTYLRAVIIKKGTLEDKINEKTVKTGR